MSKGSPSLVALLGLLAVAGYQNREKLSGMLQGATDRAGTGDMRLDPPDGMAGGGLVENLRGLLQGAGGGGLVTGLSEFLGRFSNPVQSAKAQSWVDTGPNGDLAPGDLEEVLDEDTLAELAQKTGLSRADLLARLSAVLPTAVDRLTPNGRMPTEDEARGLI
jgi:uncharacterized protein YidB (DUF937 family)